MQIKNSSVLAKSVTIFVIWGANPLFSVKFEIWNLDFFIFKMLKPPSLGCFYFQIS